MHLSQGQARISSGRSHRRDIAVERHLTGRSVDLDFGDMHPLGKV